MDINSLKLELDEALKHYCENSSQTVSNFSDDDKMKELARFISEDTFKCLSEFENAILKAFAK